MPRKKETRPLEPVGKWEATAARARRTSAIRARRQNITPDRIIICPKCGTEIRVGKTLV